MLEVKPRDTAILAEIESLVPRHEEDHSEIFVDGDIRKGDRASRFRLMDDGQFTGLALGDDLYRHFFLAAQLSTAIEQAEKHRQAFVAEWEVFIRFLDQWLVDNECFIIKKLTKLSNKPTTTRSGKIRFSIVITARCNDPEAIEALESKLDALDTKVMNDFQIIRLDSILIPPLKEEIEAYCNSK